MNLLTKNEVIALDPNVNNVWAVRKLIIDTSKLPSRELPDVEGFLVSKDVPKMPKSVTVEHDGFRVSTVFGVQRLLDFDGQVDWATGLDY